MEVLLHGDRIQTVADFHAQVRESLDLPDYYGDNLDALWDCLKGWIDTPLTFIWKDFEQSKEYLGEDIGKIISVLKDAEREIDGFELKCR